MKLELQMRTRNVNFDRYTEVYFSDAFNQLALEAARLRSRELIQQETLPDGRELRRVRLVPEVALPAPIKALLKGNEISYHEVTVFDRANQRARLDVRTPAGKTVRVGGDVEFVQQGADMVLHFKGEVRVHVFGLGGLIEKLIVQQVAERYAAVESVLQRYVDGTTPA